MAEEKWGAAKVFYLLLVALPMRIGLMLNNGIGEKDVT